MTSQGIANSGAICIGDAIGDCFEYDKVAIGRLCNLHQQQKRREKEKRSKRNS
jgi:hypothetical protein